MFLVTKYVVVSEFSPGPAALFLSLRGKRTSQKQDQLGHGCFSLSVSEINALGSSESSVKGGSEGTHLVLKVDALCSALFSTGALL